MFEHSDTAPDEFNFPVYGIYTSRRYHEPRSYLYASRFQREYRGEMRGDEPRARV